MDVVLIHSVPVACVDQLASLPEEVEANVVAGYGTAINSVWLTAGRFLFNDTCSHYEFPMEIQDGGICSRFSSLGFCMLRV